MADPFDALRQPVVPIDPRPEFAADLRGRLLRELGIISDTGGTMATTAAVRARSLTPYICVSPAADALAFYGRAFGAVETMRVAGDDGKIGHAEIAIGDVRIMMSDEFPEMAVLSPTSLGGAAFAMYLDVDDVDAAYDRAVAAGATSLRPPENQDHGNRTATISDPFGHRWMLSQPIEDVSLADYRDRAAESGWEVTGQPDAMGAPAPPTGQLGYYTLSVPDVGRGVAFYGALFAWHFDGINAGTDGNTYAHVSNTNLPFGLVDDMAMPSPNHFYRVDDLDAMVAKVRELGGEVLDVTDYPSGGNARCRDDQGVEFQLWKPAPEYE